jgi:hypothetical protein
LRAVRSMSSYKERACAEWPARASPMAILW